MSATFIGNSTAIQVHTCPGCFENVHRLEDGWRTLQILFSSGTVQAGVGAIHSYVPKESLPPLVHWRGHG